MSSAWDGGVGAAVEAFSLLTDETRLRILRILAVHEREHDFDEGMTFADLRSAVGVDDAGRFNYHLDKLRGHFLRKEDDEYRLRYAGLRVVSEVASGAYGGSVETLRSDTGYDCPYPDCPDPLSAVYEDELVRLECPDHGAVFQTTLPPNVTDGRDAVEVADIADLATRNHLQQLQRGTCPFCWGSVEHTVPYEPAPDSGDQYCHIACEDCWLDVVHPVSAFAAHHPAVVSFYYEKGIDIREEPYVALDFVRNPETATVESTDPTRVRVDVELDGDRVELTYDGDLSVVDASRYSPP